MVGAMWWTPAAYVWDVSGHEEKQALEIGSFSDSERRKIALNHVPQQISANFLMWFSTDKDEAFCLSL